MGKTIATNKKAFRDFFISDKRECGIELKGGEVKSVRAGHVNFKDSFARLEKGEVFLYSLHIEPYKQASYLNDEPDRRRRLLLHKKEIAKIAVSVNEKKLALVPTAVYFNNRGLVKVEIGLGKGKKRYDKREAIKKRTIDKAIDRTLKSRRR